MRLKTIGMIILSNMLISCGQTVYIQPRLPLPDQLVTPKLAKKDFQCLDKATRDKLALVLAARKARIKRLRSTIKTTHGQVK